MFLIAVPAIAQETAQDETVDVKGIIFGHLKDSYHWHIITIGNKEISLHLPVILYSKVTGWHFFSSRQLEHTGSYEGFHITDEGAHAGKLVETLPDGTELKPLDLSLTKIALAVIINSLLLCVIVMCTARWYRRHSATDPAPGGFVGLMEYVIAMIVDDVIKPSVGKDYKRYTPLLLTIFFFILLSNIMGLIPIFPAGANVTGNIYSGPMYPYSSRLPFLCCRSLRLWVYSPNRLPLRFVCSPILPQVTPSYCRLPV